MPTNNLHMIGSFVAFSVFPRCGRRNRRKQRRYLWCLRLLRQEVSKTLIPQFVPQHLNCTLFGFRRMLREEYRLRRNNYRTVTPCSGDFQVVFFFNGIDPTRKGAHPAFFRKSQTRVFCKLTRHWKQSVFLLYIEVSSLESLIKRH